MELTNVPIDKPTDVNFILGQSHFIKTIEDLHEAVVQTVPQMKFGIAFCESSGPALVRRTGNDPELIEFAQKNALALSCGHCFIVFMTGGFPIRGSHFSAVRRDTREAIAKYLESFDPRIVGLTGTQHQIDDIVREYRVFVEKDAAGGADYLVTHSAFNYLMNPQGKFVNIVESNAPGEDIAARLRKQMA